MSKDRKRKNELGIHPGNTNPGKKTKSSAGATVGFCGDLQVKVEKVESLVEAIADRMQDLLTGDSKFRLGALVDQLALLVRCIPKPRKA